MHLYFWLRGVNWKVNIIRAFLESQYFKWRRISLKTNDEDFKLIQGALRPTLWGAYEYVFPEEALPEVLAMLGVPEHDTKHLRLKLVRPLFNCKKIPKKIWEKARKSPPTLSIKDSWRGLGNCNLEGVAIHIVGIKKDRYAKCPEWGYEQEML